MTTPACTCKSAGAAPKRWAARSSSQARACAAPARKGAACICSDVLAMVGPWFGAKVVLPNTTCTSDRATSNSSATTCASAVPMPVPKSTWPCKAVTLPSSHTASKISTPSAGLLGTAEGWPLTGGGGGGGSRVMSNTPVAAWKSARRWGWAARRVMWARLACAARPASPLE